MRALAIDGVIQTTTAPRVQYRPVYGDCRAAGVVRRCKRAAGHAGECDVETREEADARRERGDALDISPTQVSPHVTQTLVSGTPLMPDGTYTEFTFVPREGMLKESDLEIGQRIRMDARLHRGPLIDGTIVSLSFDVRARKTIVRVRS